MSSKYKYVTSAAIPPFSRKTIYCVHFIYRCKWFETMQQAEEYRTYLYENNFFSFTSVELKSMIIIKEYIIE